MIKIVEYHMGLEKKGFEFIKDMDNDQLEILQEMITEIDEEIEKRHEISKVMLKYLDGVIAEITNQLRELPTINPASHDSQGFGSEIVKGMTELRKAKVGIEEMKAQEQINLWRDIANLKREKRLVIREFRERESKTDILDDLIGE